MRARCTRKVLFLLLTVSVSAIASPSVLASSSQIKGAEGLLGECGISATRQHKTESQKDNLHQLEEAIETCLQLLTDAREIGDRQSEIYALEWLSEYYRDIGEAYFFLGQLRQAIDSYGSAVDFAQQAERDDLAALALNFMGYAYYELGQYEQAIALNQQALTVAQEVDYFFVQALSLADIGLFYFTLGDYEQAAEFANRALVVSQEHRIRRIEAYVLNDLGRYHQATGEPQEAILFHQRSTEAAQDLGIDYWQSITLNDLGNAYQASGQYQQAMESYQQALAIAQEIGYLASERSVLSSIGSLLAQQNQPELAILFYKQSVNASELMRQDLQTLPQDIQKSYVETVASTYRSLANLLLQQNRVLEAQQVLDLLRVQELDDYLRSVRSTTQTRNGIDLEGPEIEINNRVIAIGYELAQLREIPPAQLSEAQLQQLSELDRAQQAMAEDFQAFIDSPEIQALVAQLDTSVQQQDLLGRMEEFINLQNNLRDINQNAVLIYPLILPDRLELVLVTPFSEPTRYPVAVKQEELNAAIVAFRQALDDPTSDPRMIAQQLYAWLIAPMANDLEAIGAETLLYAPDGALRYIPLAALHDGDQWLIERFHINHITAASLQDFTLRPEPQLQILAAAFSDGFFEFEMGQRSFSFAGLPFTEVEVENLVAAFPGTTQLMNDNFSRARLEPVMDSHTIIHLATHAAFVPGSPSDSFILFGNGDRLTLQEIKESWQGRFNRVELIVLSACETGIGEDNLGRGEEILGFGYLMQEAGAEAAIASLWSVNDGGTQILMNAFYSALNEGMTKTEALQQAQVALITGDLTAVGSPRGNGTIEFLSAETGLPAAVSSNLNHPYYWAPFILIGNGL